MLKIRDRDNITELEEKLCGRKFEACIGNPPYQNSETNNKSQVLWWKFLKKSLKISSRISFICPPSWLAPGTKFDLMRQQNVVRVDLTVGRYFAGIASMFCSVYIDNTKPRSKTLFITSVGDFESDLTTDFIPYDMSVFSRSIVNKMIQFGQSNGRYTFQGSDEYYSTDKNDWMSDEGVEVFHTHAQAFKTNVFSPNNDLIRVGICHSGSSKAFVANKIGITEATDWTVVSSLEEANNLAGIFNSKVYQFFLNANKWSGWNLPNVIHLLPYIDFSQLWFDADLYQHFDLSQEEIIYIESKVK